MVSVLEQRIDFGQIEVRELLARVAELFVGGAIESESANSPLLNMTGVSDLSSRFRSWSFIRSYWVLTVMKGKLDR